MTTPIGGSTLATTKAVLVPSLKVSNAGEFTLADVDPIGRTEVMIVSKPGGGKTVMATTFPPPFRWIAADGRNSLKSVRWAFQAGITALTRFEDLRAYTPVEDVTKGTYVDNPRAFNEMCDRVDFWFSPEELPKWENGTLVLDSMTSINDWTMNMGLSINQKFPSTSKPLSGSHEINKKALARIVTGQQDYKSSMALMEGWLMDVRGQCAKHNRNLVILCHEFTEQDEEGAVLSYAPQLHGQLRTKVAKDFDDVWWMQVYNGKEFKVQVHADPKHPCKTRWGQVLSKEEPADFRAMMAKVKEFHGIPLTADEKLRIHPPVVKK